MIVDTSALVALIKGEPTAPACARAIQAADSPRISAANAFEAAIVVDAVANPVLSRGLDQLRRELEVAIHPVTAQHVDIARQAYRDYGKGSGHPAQLNFGDCFAYALAAETGEPLLFVGDDFMHTDIEPALPAS
jgi:ribonuclease VapC